MKKHFFMGFILTVQELADAVRAWEDKKDIAHRYGADMHPDTYRQVEFLFPATTSKNILPRPFGGVDIHQRSDIPFGEIHECTCQLGTLWDFATKDDTE